MNSWRNILPSGVGALCAETPALVILDVRTPEEFTAHHLPGAALIPIQELGARLGELGSKRQPLLVHCEHGIRSRHACEFLAQMGFVTLYDLTGGLAAWDETRDGTLERGPQAAHDWPLPPRELGEWLPHHFALPATGAPALDLAAGRGRVSHYLRAEGFTVTAVDRDLSALQTLAAGRSAEGGGVELMPLDLELPAGIAALESSGRFALICAVNYLYRPLLPALVRCLAPGGLLFYSTFVADPRATTGPRNPDHLLQPGELAAAFPGTRLLEYRERREGTVTRASVLCKEK